MRKKRKKKSESANKNVDVIFNQISENMDLVDIRHYDDILSEYRKLNDIDNNYGNLFLNELTTPSREDNIILDQKSVSDYKSIKVPLYPYIKDQEVYNKLLSLIFTVKQIKVTLYLFIRLYIVFKYNEIANKFLEEGNPNYPIKNLPIVNEEFVFCCIHTLTTKDKRGPPIKNVDKLKLLIELAKFYRDHFLKLVPNHTKLSVTNCSQLMSYICTEVVTNYNNVIEVYFFECFFRFVNAYNRSLFKENIDNCKTKSELKKINKYINSIARIVKTGLLTETYNEIQNVIPNILMLKDFILPKLSENKTHKFGIQENPQKYLPYMINMNVILETLGKKPFQVLPLSKSLIPDHIKIDTKMLVDLFVDDGKKKEYLDNIEKYQPKIWSRYFKINSRVFKRRKNFVFDYMINTDGKSVTLSFFREGAKKYKGGNSYKHKSKDLPYIDELSINQLNKIRKSTMVYDDPGKKNIHFMMNNQRRRLRYSSKRRTKELQTIEHRAKIEEFKNEPIVTIGDKQKTIKEIESELNKLSSKTYDYENFGEYVKEKMRQMYQLCVPYQSEIFRSWRYRSYINKQRSESKLVNEIIKTFGENDKPIYIFIGNWSQTKQMRNFISTPGKGLIKKISKLSNGRIKFIQIDEFRTSCLDYKTGELMENKTVQLEGKSIKLHSVLTRKEETKSMECIQRDYNSVMNYRTIVQYYMKYNSRPLAFMRGIELKEMQGKEILRIGINKDKDWYALSE